MKNTRLEFGGSSAARGFTNMRDDQAGFFQVGLRAEQSAHGRVEQLLAGEEEAQAQAAAAQQDRAQVLGAAARELVVEVAMARGSYSAMEAMAEEQLVAVMVLEVPTKSEPSPRIRLQERSGSRRQTRLS